MSLVRCELNVINAEICWRAAQTPDIRDGSQVSGGRELVTSHHTDNQPGPGVEINHWVDSFISRPGGRPFRRHNCQAHDP